LAEGEAISRPMENNLEMKEKFHRSEDKKGTRREGEQRKKTNIDGTWVEKEFRRGKVTKVADGVAIGREGKDIEGARAKKHLK